MSRFVVLVLLSSVVGVPAVLLDGEAGVSPLHTRVFYLDGADARAAVTLLRSEIQVRRVAYLSDRPLVIVSETAERIDLVESLLRERGMLARAVEPHPPLASDTEGMTARVLRLASLDSAVATMLLRTIYGVREVEPQSDGAGVAARAPASTLEAAEALFRELGQPDARTGSSVQQRDDS